MKAFLLLFFLLITPAFGEKSIQLFVALCDNKTQGIAKVGAKIGNGDDAANNLYWGCSDGARSYFKTSKCWTLEKTGKPSADFILETLHFKHKASGTLLTAHAYRGSQMEKCLEDYFQALKSSGPNELVAFIGHNGLMDTSPKFPETAESDLAGTPTIILCCISDRYFQPHLKRYQAKPLLLTRQLMYPGDFILHDAIEVWLKDGEPTDYVTAAAKAYAKNQGVSTWAAKTVFTAPE